MIVHVNKARVIKRPFPINNMYSPPIFQPIPHKWQTLTNLSLNHSRI